MKALEKDRTRRYETATGLVRDIERYLLDKAVEASPPSASYRLRKFTRRHRAPLAITASFLLLLVTGPSSAPTRRSGYWRSKKKRWRRCWKRIVSAIVRPQ